MTEYKIILAMLMSIARHMKTHINEFNDICDTLSIDDVDNNNLEIEEKLELVKKLKTELKVIKGDAERALLYFDDEIIL
jgi:hypothetical protein